MSDLMLTFIPYKNFNLLYSRVGARPEPHPNFRPKPEPEQHKNDAAPQHWFKQLESQILNDTFYRMYYSSDLWK
jgi:hypothetical protein